MKAIYSEIYGKDNDNQGYCIPLVEFCYTIDERHLLPKSKYIIEEQEEELCTSYVPFFNTFFDGLKEETIAKLQSILDFANKAYKVEYINKNLWKAFLFTSNIEINNTKKVYNTHLEHEIDPNSKKPLYKNYNRKSSKQLIVEKYYNSRVSNYDSEIAVYQNDLYKTLLNYFPDNIKPSLKSNFIPQKARDKDLHILNFMKNGVFGGIINIDYSFDFKNENDLLYTFLDCIFQSEYNYKIKQCKRCPNFFITLNTKENHCPYCLPIINKLQKQNYENKELVKIERRIGQLFYAPNRINEKETFLNNKKAKKEDLINKKITEEEYIKWLVSHYKTKNK